MRDISNREDIILLVNTFYDKVKQDDTIGYIFNEIIGDDWSHHLPVMYNFWEMVLFQSATYTGNPIRAHINLDKRLPLTAAHFERWMALWKETVDNLFSGEKASEIKTRAALMKDLIHHKINASRDGKNIL